MKNLLMLNATMSDKTLIMAAKRLGYHVITTGNRPSYKGHDYSSEYVFGDYSNLEEMLELSKRHDIEAVSCGTSDNTAITAAFLGERLGLKGHDSPSIADAMHRKGSFKAFAREHGVSSPLAMLFLDRAAALSHASAISFPAMVKPFDTAGGKGASKAECPAQFRQAVETAFACSDAGIVVEPFVEGPQYSFLCFLVDAKARAFCTWSDHSYRFPFMVSGGVMPADVSDDIVSLMVSEMEKIAQAANLVDGILNAQFIVSDGVPWIIEVMRRSPGNWTTSLVSRATGVDWNEWIIKAEAGLDCSGMPQVSRVEGYYGYASLLAPREGVFSGLRVADELLGNITVCEIWGRLGHVVEDATYDKLGLVQMEFGNKEEAERKTAAFYELVEIEMR